MPGSILGILVFLGGIALLLLTFKIAYDMFQRPPSEALGLEPGKPMQLQIAGSNFAGTILRVLLLALMGLVGSLVASKGIHLYASLATHRHTVVTKSVPQPETKPAEAPDQST